MNQIEVGTEVRHKTSGERGVVTEISGPDATVSFGSDDTKEIPLAALEALDEDEESSPGIEPHLW